MTRKSKSKKVVGNIKETLLLLVIIVIVIYILYKVGTLLIKPTNTFMVQQDTISNEKSVVGYIVREETVIRGDNYENGIVQIKSEGEKVSSGTKIFRYYASNEKEMNKKISDLNIEIQAALEGQTHIFSSDVKSIESQVDLVLKSIKEKNNVQEIQEYKMDIDTYITKKAKILGELSSSSTYIKELINSKEGYQKQLDENSETMTANSSGIVSYRVDGLENVLTPNNFENITKETLEQLNLKTGQIISTSNNEAKIINNYYCYIITIVDTEDIVNAKVGSNLKIRLSTQDEIFSKIEYMKNSDNNKTILILKITKEVEYLINYRKISFEIVWWSETGFKVPNSTIIYDNGLSYVIRNRIGYLNKILVKIVQTNGKYSIVENYDSEELEEIGFSDKEIKNMKDISLYDEILVKPDLDELK